MHYIDAHAHVWTADTRAYPRAPGHDPAQVRPDSFTAEDFFAQARPAGVDRVNLIQPACYGFDNSYLLDTIRRLPRTCVGTAVINPLAAGPECWMRALAAQGVRAFRIHPRLSQQPAASWLRPAGYTEMFAAAARHGLALSCLIDPDGLPEVDRMCAAHPGTTVILDHLARVGGDGTIRDVDVTALCGLARHARVLMKLGAFYALGAKRPPYDDLIPLIRAVVRAFGGGRCLWESDCPHQLQTPHTYAASIDLVRRLDFLTAADREALLRTTAERVLFRE